MSLFLYYCFTIRFILVLCFVICSVSISHFILNMFVSIIIIIIFLNDYDMNIIQKEWQNDRHKILWDFSVQKVHFIETRKPNFIVINKEISNYQIIFASYRNTIQVNSKQRKRLKNIRTWLGSWRNYGTWLLKWFQ